MRLTLQVVAVNQLGSHLTMYLSARPSCVRTQMPQLHGQYQHEDTQGGMLLLRMHLTSWCRSNTAAQGGPGWLLRLLSLFVHYIFPTVLVTCMYVSASTVEATLYQFFVRLYSITKVKGQWLLRQTTCTGGVLGHCFWEGWD